MGIVRKAGKVVGAGSKLVLKEVREAYALMKKVKRGLKVLFIMFSLFLVLQFFQFLLILYLVFR